MSERYQTAQASSTRARPSRTPLLIMPIGLVGLLLTIYAATYALVTDRFLTIESDAMQRDVARASDALQSELRSLNSKAGDWANWSDTYRFMAGTNPDFLDINIVDYTYQQLEINLILLVRSNGELAFGGALDLASSQPASVPASLLTHLAPGSPLMGGESGSDEVTGVVNLPEGPLLVASRPILDSEGNGPSHGRLILARFLDEALLEQLADETHLDLSLHLFAQLPDSHEVAIAQRLSPTNPVAVQPIGPNLMDGYLLMLDVHGVPLLMLEVETPRPIYQQGQATLASFGLTLLILGSSGAVASYLLGARLLRSRQERLEAEQRYHTAVDQSLDGFAMVDVPTRYVLEANAALAALAARPLESLPTTKLDDLLDVPSATVDRWVRTILNGAVVHGQEVHLRRLGGGRTPVEVSAGVLDLATGPCLAFVFRDISERQQAQHALRESEERYALAARGANDGLWDWDLSTDAIHYSDRWKRMLGYSGEQIDSNIEEWLGRVHPEERSHIRMALQVHREGTSSHFESEFRMLHRDGQYRWMLCRGQAVFDASGLATRMAGSLTDITERKRAEEQLIHDAMHDTLTGLPNRALFLDRLGRAQERSRRHAGSSFAVLFLDLDRFKVVNDSLGHMSGDEVLQEVGQRLVGSTRSEDTVARFGGDEFAVLVEEVSTAADASRVALRIETALGQPIFLRDQEIFPAVSIGIALNHSGYLQPGEILRDADIALYRAKALGRGRHEVFDADLGEQALALLHLETDLRRALRDGEFRLVYQPILSLDQRMLHGFEALVRWQHPTRGLLPPSEFIPLAEETGLIVPMGAWVLREATRQGRLWQDARPALEPLTMSVNLSSRQFSHPDLPALVEAALSESGLPPSCLELEVTESVLIDNPQAAQQVLERFREMGIRLALDDFGTGYSALSYLHRFPFQTLKIDRSFISGIDSNGKNPAIVRAIVTLAENLGMEAVAEGVEHEAEEHLLRQLHCRYVQGYLYARPMDPQAAEQWLLLPLADLKTA
jgi:diguanylate cyclase (GGDEF)-like protein/PAS domain S-box-containing protein